MFYPFLLTIIAGLSTLIGTFPIFIKFKNTNNIISASCSFAAGVMLCVTIIDLIPEALKSFNYSIILTILFILIGIIISYIIDKYLDKINNSYLYKTGLLSMIVIILHNIPEGIITYLITSKNILLGISLCIAISLHNIPEGITISVPIYYSTKNKKKALLYTFIAAISEPFGGLLSYIFLSKYINNLIIAILFGIISGIMIEISVNNLIPLSIKYNSKLLSIFFLLGFIIMLISLYLS